MDIYVWLPAWPQLLAAFGLGYLLGSIPFGLILARGAGLGDLRQIGSGNIGATNVLRTGNKAVAVLTLLLDIGKGTLAVVLAGFIGVHTNAPEPALLAGAGALLGHMFPIWLRFRGGKGVATALGVVLALSWPAGVIACLTWILAAGLFRFSSVAALAAMAAAPGYMLHFRGADAAWLTAMIGVLVWIRHWQNLKRLATGQEPRIRFKRNNNGNE